MKNESIKTKNKLTVSQSRNKSNKSNKVCDYKETTSWASLKDYFNFQPEETRVQDKKH